MKIPTTTILITLILLPGSFLQAQTGGSLTPPGTPGMTMKSLDEMEPRTPLVAGATGVAVSPSGTITISQSGSYYLTENLTVTGGNGIQIDASGVTLDLRGFTVRSTALYTDSDAISDAIDVNGNNVSIFNGHIESGTTWDGSSFTSATGFGTGISSGGPGLAFGAYPRNIRVRDVSVQGVAQSGIILTGFGQTCVVESCVVDVAGLIGISAGLVKNSVATTCGATGISSFGLVANCRGESVLGSGINASVVSHSVGGTTSEMSDSHGITASRTVENSYGYSWGGSGISCDGSVSNSYGRSTGTGDGISANNVTGSYGISDDGGDGIYGRNVSNSYGYCPGGTGNGIYADGNVTNSYGYTESGQDGIYGRNVSNSTGYCSGSGNGINARANVTNSYGSTDSGDYAIYGQNVLNSYGINYWNIGETFGIFALGNVMNSRGFTYGDGDGIYASGSTVSYSEGDSIGSGVGIRCAIGVACTSGGGEAIDHKYLMP